jgi:hypothetical protein
MYIARPISPRPLSSGGATCESFPFCHFAPLELGTLVKAGIYTHSTPLGLSKEIPLLRRSNQCSNFVHFDLAIVHIQRSQILNFKFEIDGREYLTESGICI